MPIWLCEACGTSFPPGEAPPEGCPICDDARQFVPPRGQGWTTREALAAGHANAWRELEQGLLQIETVPRFAIGQRALLLRTGAGNFLWDCLALLDAATIEVVRALGGVAGVAISHPHYYTTCQDWARAFECPVHLHAADREWLQRPCAAVRFWEGETTALAEGVTLVRLGGHFPGGAVLHWAEGAGGAGALLSGDIIQVTPGADRVSFMWSYPNMRPLSAGAARRIAGTIAGWRFARIYGAFAGRQVMADGNAVVAASTAEYCAALEGAQEQEGHSTSDVARVQGEER